MSCYAPTRGTWVLVEMFVLTSIGTPMRTSLFDSMPCFNKKRKHDTIIKMERRVKHLRRNQFAEMFGWIGTVLVLGAYALISLNIIDSNSVSYHVMFLIGSAGLAVITYRHRAFQSFIVNLTFVGLATVAIVRLVLFP